VGFATLFETVEIYDAETRKQLSADLKTLRNPAKHTLQLRSPGRVRARFIPGDVNVVACASEDHRVAPNGPVQRYGIRKPWLGSRRGLDGWAEAANGRETFEQTNTNPYCLQGPNPHTVAELGDRQTERCPPQLDASRLGGRHRSP
jgi:hypothetical protein